MPILPPKGFSDTLAVLVRGIPFEAGTQDVREHFKVQDHTPARPQAHTRAHARDAHNELSRVRVACPSWLQQSKRDCYDGTRTSMVASAQDCGVIRKENIPTWADDGGVKVTRRDGLELV